MYEPRPASPPPEWTPEVKALIEEVQRAAPPEKTFFLFPWAEVTDPVKFHASLLADVVHGPGGPRAILGALAQELRAYVGVLRSLRSSS